MSSVTMAADSTQSGWEKAYGKTKKKHKKEKKKKKHGKTRDENDSEHDSDLDLDKDLKPIGGYLRDREAMVDHMFRSISCKKLQAMLPEILKPIPSDDLRHMCKETLEVMSRKRITRILAGADPETISSSGTDDDYSDDPNAPPESEDDVPVATADSTSRHSHRSISGSLSPGHSDDPHSAMSSVSSIAGSGSTNSSRSQSPSGSEKLDYSYQEDDIAQMEVGTDVQLQQQNDSEDDVIVVKEEPISPSPSPPPPPAPPQLKLRKKNKLLKSTDEMEEGELDSETEYETDTEEEEDIQQKDKEKEEREIGPDKSVTHREDSATHLPNSSVDNCVIKTDPTTSVEQSGGEIKGQEMVDDCQAVRVIVVEPMEMDEDIDPIIDSGTSNVVESMEDTDFGKDDKAVPKAESLCSEEADNTSVVMVKDPSVADTDATIVSVVVDEIMVMEVLDHTSDLSLDLDIINEKLPVDQETQISNMGKTITKTVPESSTKASKNVSNVEGTRRKIVLHRSDKDQPTTQMSRIVQSSLPKDPTAQIQESRKVYVSKKHENVSKSGKSSKASSKNVTPGKKLQADDTQLSQESDLSASNTKGKTATRKVQLPKNGAKVKKHVQEKDDGASVNEAVEGDGLLSKTQMEILELEMRARAIKAMIKAAEDEEEGGSKLTKRKQQKTSSLVGKKVNKNPPGTSSDTRKPSVSKRSVQVPHAEMEAAVQRAKAADQLQQLPSVSDKPPTVPHRQVEPTAKKQFVQHDRTPAGSNIVGSQRKLVIQGKPAVYPQQQDNSHRIVQKQKEVAQVLPMIAGQRSVSLEQRPRHVAQTVRSEQRHVQMGGDQAGQHGRRLKQTQKVVQLKRRSTEDTGQIVKMKKL